MLSARNALQTSEIPLDAENVTAASTPATTIEDPNAAKHAESLANAARILESLISKYPEDASLKTALASVRSDISAGNFTPAAVKEAYRYVNVESSSAQNEAQTDATAEAAATTVKIMASTASRAATAVKEAVVATVLPSNDFMNSERFDFLNQNQNKDSYGISLNFDASGWMRGVSESSWQPSLNSSLFNLSLDKNDPLTQGFNPRLYDPVKFNSTPLSLDNNSTSGFDDIGRQMQSFNESVELAKKSLRDSGVQQASTDATVTSADVNKLKALAASPSLPRSVSGGDHFSAADTNSLASTTTYNPEFNKENSSLPSLG